MLGNSNGCTILVTGAAGFIGSHVCEALLKDGDQVLGVDNFDSFYSSILKERNLRPLTENPSFRFVKCDIRDADALSRLAADTNVSDVIHLAGKAGVRPSVEDPVTYFDVNVSGTVELMRTLGRHGVKRFVLGSSSSVYGDSAPIPFSESDASIQPLSPYAASKRAMELAAHSLCETQNLSALCLRFFTVYGPRQRPDLAIRKFSERIWNGQVIELFGDLDSGRDYTFISDTVNGVLSGMKWLRGQGDSAFEIINLGNSNPISLFEMVQHLEDALGRKAFTKRLPRQTGDVYRTCASMDKAHQLLGYEPEIPFETGIRKFSNWFLKNKSEAG